MKFLDENHALVEVSAHHEAQNCCSNLDGIIICQRNLLFILPLFIIWVGIISNIALDLKIGYAIFAERRPEIKIQFPEIYSKLFEVFDLNSQNLLCLRKILIYICRLSHQDVRNNYLLFY